jgi:hypothetical protein
MYFVNPQIPQNALSPATYPSPRQAVFQARRHPGFPKDAQHRDIVMTVTD